MDYANELVATHYVYRSLATSPSRRQRPSLYLVERVEGSTVVARIPSLPNTDARNGVRASALRVAGPWQHTSSRHHSRVRVTLADAV
ncbi:MAG TPA: hypothetical protein VND89_05140 [Acidimicrobiales bacterium]|nr:hypothetical protein [Acidimicrobiales bacterium]